MTVRDDPRLENTSTSMPDARRRCISRRPPGLSPDNAFARCGGTSLGERSPTMTQQNPIALAGVHELTIDEQALRSHVLRPANGVGVPSSRGLHDAPPEARAPLPAGPIYHFDVGGFGQALHAALKSSVNGYVMRLRQHGATIYTLQWEWAKRPVDG